jgi:hypothetical protein
MPSQDLIKNIEKEYLRILIDLMKNGSFNLQKAKDKTREFLAFLPFVSYEDMNSKIKQFSKDNSDFDNLFTLYLDLEEKEKTTNVLAKIRSFMEKGNVNQALNLVK